MILMINRNIHYVRPWCLFCLFHFRESRVQNNRINIINNKCLRCSGSLPNKLWFQLRMERN